MQRRFIPVFLLVVLTTLLTSTSVTATAVQGALSSEQSWISRTLAHMTLEEKVGQLFVVNAYGQSADDPDPAMVKANEALYGVANFSQLIAKYHPGGVIYFNWSNNLNSPAQIVALSNGLQHTTLSQPTPVPLLISTDQEQGEVLRIGPPATVFPGNMALGATRDFNLAQRAAAITGVELRAMGINVDNAPVVDVNSNPLNQADGIRAYGDRTQFVAQFAHAQVIGYHQGGVGPTAKHFPGLGEVTINTDNGVAISNQTLAQVEEINLPPFAAAIRAGVDQVMVGHIVLPKVDPSQLPASLSRRIVTDLLRQQLGYDGVVITDALNAAALNAYSPAKVAVLALEAGDDQLLEIAEVPASSNLAVAYNAVLQAVRTGGISQARLDQSVRRILRLKWQLGLVAAPYTDPTKVSQIVGTPAHLAVAQESAERSITLIKNAAHVLPLRAHASFHVLVTGFGVVSTATIRQDIAARGLTTQVLTTGFDPDQATINHAVAAARQSDLVVVTTFNAWGAHGQPALVSALLATGKPVVVAALGTPYDIAYFPAAPTFVATYDYQPVSLHALVRVLFGEVNPSGKLPVTITAPPPSHTVLYPFGYGLEYRH
jgi:beta-N-acetylhexosaminidase